MPRYRAMSRWRSLVLGLFCVVTFTSCSAIVSPDTGALGPAPSPCKRDCYVNCPCIEGGQGRQICTPAEQFSDCQCGVDAMTLVTTTGLPPVLCATEQDNVAAPSAGTAPVAGVAPGGVAGVDAQP